MCLVYVCIREFYNMIVFVVSFVIILNLNLNLNTDSCCVIMQDTLQLILRDKTYESQTAAKLTCVISNALKTRMKGLALPRHKLVCHVVLAPSVENTSLQVTSRCLWDCRHDNYACVMYDDGGIHCVATVFGVYFE